MSIASHDNRSNIGAAKAECWLSERGGYNFTLFNAATNPPMSQILDLVDRAWSHDYRGRAIIQFDEAYLDWLTAGNDWFGIAARDGDGNLVGMELALGRNLNWNGHLLKSFYVTLLTCDPDHRGRGIAQRILHHLTEQALEENQADLIVSSFDAGAAGRPTVEKSVSAGAYPLALALSKPMSMWACTRSLREVDAYEPLAGVSRAALWPGIRQLLEFSPGDNVIPADVRPTRPGRAAKDSSSSTGFGFVGSFDLDAMYDERHGGHSGTWQIDAGHGQTAAVAWHKSWIARSALPDRQVATLQLMQCDALSRCQQVRCLRQLNQTFLNDGCFAVTALQTGSVSSSVLWRAGFRPTPRRIHLAVRGRETTIRNAGQLRGPFSVDLL